MLVVGPMQRWLGLATLGTHPGGSQLGWKQRIIKDVTCTPAAFPSIDRQVRTIDLKVTRFRLSRLGSYLPVIKMHLSPVCWTGTV
jgi:hypothetical protein